MEDVLVRRGNPKFVFEDDETHYFYWPIEFGAYEIELGKRRIPIFPIKRLDYEPIKVIIYDHRKIVVSRFHYRVLTFFSRPKLVNNKAVVDFSFGSHSPFVHTERKPGIRVGFDILVYVDMDSRELDQMIGLLALYILINAGRKNVALDNLKTYNLVSGTAPDEARFIINDMVAVVWYGARPENDEMNFLGYARW
ncbi:MAG: hypothetical protein ACREBU_15775 [Nitrososphaera sp.]